MSITEEPSELDDHIGADIQSELKQQVRVQAAKEGIGMAAFVRKALRNELDRD